MPTVGSIGSSFPQPQSSSSTSLRPDGPFGDNAQLAAVASGSATITNGARGDGVKLVQQALMGLGYDMPRWGADGAWGGESGGALKAFQHDSGLPETGTVDSATLAAIDAKVAGGSSQAGGLRPGSPLASEAQLQEVAAGGSTLANGSRGTGVKALQQALLDLGLDVSGGADGWYGRGTMAAVSSFQGTAGLPQTGVCDKATLLAVDAKLGGTGGTTTNPLPASSPFAGDETLAGVATGAATLARGARGEGVKLVQQALIDVGIEVRGGADGVFGGGTKAALSTFQGQQHLPKTGVLDKATLMALDGRLAAGNTQGVTPGTNVQGAEARGIQNPRFQAAGFARVASGQGTIGRGASGPEVKASQRALLDLGFKLPRFGADGSYGAEMGRAVWRFQMEMGLERTGVIDQATLEALDRVAPPPGKALEKMPNYEAIFEDGRADITIGIGFDEGGTHTQSVQKTERNLIKRGFSRIDPESMSSSERERLGLAGDRYTPGAIYYLRTAEDPNTGKEVDYVCRLISPDSSDDPSEVAKMFKNAMENDEIVMYNGHARYGTGPDFDDIHSGAGNFVINEQGNSHGSPPPHYLSDAIAGRDTDLPGTGGPGHYQLLYFGACSTENYLENLRGRFPGRNNDNTDIVATTMPTFVASGSEHVDIFLNGLMNRESMNTISDRINENEVGWHNYFGPDDPEDQRHLEEARGTMMDNGMLGNQHNHLVDSPN